MLNINIPNRKIMKMNRKGITPIVATILLLLLTVAVGGFTYVWMTRVQKGITGGITERITKALTGMKASGTIESIWGSGTQLNLSVRNNGDVDLDFSTDTANIFCNGKPLSITAVGGETAGLTLAPGDTTIVTVDCSAQQDLCCCDPGLNIDSVTLKITIPETEIMGTLYNKSSIGTPSCV